MYLSATRNILPGSGFLPGSGVSLPGSVGTGEYPTRQCWYGGIPYPAVVSGTVPYPAVVSGTVPYPAVWYWACPTRQCCTGHVLPGSVDWVCPYPAVLIGSVPTRQWCLAVPTRSGVCLSLPAVVLFNLPAVVLVYPTRSGVLPYFSLGVGLGCHSVTYDSCHF